MTERKNAKSSTFQQPVRANRQAPSCVIRSVIILCFAKKTPKLFAPLLLFLLAGAFPLMAEGGNVARLGRASAVSVWHNSPDMTPEKAIDAALPPPWGAQDRHAWYQIEWQESHAVRGAVMRNYDAPWKKN